MNNNCIEQTMKLLESCVLSRDNVDRELVELIVNHAKIPFFRIDRKERLLTDILGIETRKVSDNIFVVEKIINNRIDYLSPGDYVIAPRKLVNGFTQESHHVEDYLNIIKIHDGECIFQKEKIELNLRGKKENCNSDKNWKYLKIENFSSFQEKDGLIAENVIIDLRCNSGGVVSDMISTFEKIFDSEIKMFRSADTGKIDFRAVLEKKRQNVYIIADKSTCSSAEIFTGLAKKFHNAILIGTKMYGKNMLCMRRVIGEIVIHVPDKEYTVGGSSILEISPDYLVNNICEYNAEEIAKFCQEIKNSQVTETYKFGTNEMEDV